MITSTPNECSHPSPRNFDVLDLDSYLDLDSLVVEQEEWATNLDSNLQPQIASNYNTIINMLCLYRIRSQLKAKRNQLAAENPTPIHIKLAQSLSTEPNYLLQTGKIFMKQQVRLECEQLVTPLHIMKQYLYRDNLNMIILEETDKPDEVVVKEWHRVYHISLEYNEHLINYKFTSMGCTQETCRSLELSTAKACYTSYSHLSDSRDKMLNFMQSFCLDIDWNE